MADLAIGKQAIEMITTALRIPTCMHVCGNLGNVLDEILKFNVNVLDFEFSNNPANLDLLSRRDLAGRMIGYGCVDSSIEKIESIAEIKKRIEKGIEVFDPRIMLLDPDCGMRMRSRDFRGSACRCKTSLPRICCPDRRDGKSYRQGTGRTGARA